MLSGMVLPVAGNPGLRMSEKLYKIGEAAELLKLKTYVLRFWEMEFSQLTPTRTQTGQRMYTERDLAVLKHIRHLLHERGLTIEGARKLLAEDERSLTAKTRQASPAGQGSTLFEACGIHAPATNGMLAAPEPTTKARRKTAKRSPAGETDQAKMKVPSMAVAEIQTIVAELSALRDMLTGREKDEPPAANAEDTTP
jgi:DNA-binding transcriptional MerR regulator